MSKGDKVKPKTKKKTEQLQQQNNSEQLTKKDLLLLEEYKILNNYIARGASVFWSRFSIIFSINLFLFSVCSFLIKLIVELELPKEIDVFRIYISVIILCIIIGIVVTIIWYFIIEKSSAMNALWNDRMRIIENDLDSMQIQNLHFKIFNVKRKSLINIMEGDTDNTSDLKKKTKNNDVEKSDSIKFIERLRFGQRGSIGSLIRYIIFTISTLWISLSIILGILVKFALSSGEIEIGKFFYFLFIPGVLIVVYVIWSIIEWRRTQKNLINQILSKYGKTVET
ncbi:MAG: hypothetical protein HZR80_02975 [Candidatus Heimdallarchaeota archaeon]